MASVNKGHYVQALEKITPDENSSFHLLVNPRLHDFFFWHFHPEIELVFLVQILAEPNHFSVSLLHLMLMIDYSAKQAVRSMHLMS